MKISLIAAVGLSGQLGLNQGLPWSVRGDLKRFKKMTMGHYVVVGRNTWETLPPLPGRQMIVVTSKRVEGECDQVGSPQEALELAQAKGATEIFFAGGAKLYASVMPLVNTLELTTVHYDGPADTWFPAWDHDGWQLVGNESYLEDPVPWEWQTFNRT